MKKNFQFIEEIAYERQTKDTWLLFKILSEFVDGFELLRQLGPAVSIFGSARLPSTHPYAKLTRKVSEEITLAGFSLISGGGPGLMEASNKGARRGISLFKKKHPKKEAPVSVGLNILLPHEQASNRFLDIAVNFKFFFARKVMFAKYAQAFVIMPGGFGTMDEIFEAVTLIQTKKMSPMPIIMVGTEYWSGLMEWINTTMIKNKTVSNKDLGLIQLTDDPKEVVKIIRNSLKPKH